MRGAYQSKYSDLHDAISLMTVGDCLQWDIPRGSDRHSMCAALNKYWGEGSIKIRVFFECERAFIVRVK